MPEWIGQLAGRQPELDGKDPTFDDIAAARHASAVA